MGNILTEFHSFGKIKDNATLLELAKEYICHDVFLKKIGAEVKENIDELKKDISDLRKQYPGKFTTEVDAAGMIKKLEETTSGLSSHDDKLKNEIMSGKFETVLNSQLKEIKEAIKKIWVQVKGSELKYTRKDTLEGLQLQIFSRLGSVAVILGKIIAVLLVIAIGGFIYLFVTMEKPKTYQKENDASNILIEEQMDRISEIEARKAELNKSLEIEDKKEETQDRMIAMMEMETEMQELNHELHSIEGTINSRKESIEENNEKLEILSKKSFFDRLLKKKTAE
jgi:predicted nuclease with TOPRIM domain